MSAPFGNYSEPPSWQNEHLPQTAWSRQEVTEDLRGSVSIVDPRVLTSGLAVRALRVSVLKEQSQFDF